MPTIEWNRQAWGRQHSWAEDGDEWSGMAAHSGVPYEEWKRGLLEAFVLPYVGPDKDVIEVAPGHGRWSETLIGRCQSVRLVDLNPECLAACRDRFGAPGHVEYLETDGSSLPTAAASADFIWSFDSFVHIDPEDVEAYIDEFARVLRPGGYAVIHHANMTDIGISMAPRLARFGTPGAVLTRLASQHMATSGGNRSRLNGRRVARKAADAGLRVVQQTDSWGPGGRSRVARFRDQITVLRRPDREPRP